METPETTINEGGSSSVPHQEGGLISTTQFTPTDGADADPEGAKNTEGTAGGDSEKAGQEAAGKEGDAKTGEGEGKEKPSGEEDRFDKHPRFQELRTNITDLKAENQNLANQVKQLLEAQKPPSGEGEKKDLPYKDVSKMSQEELLDWQSEDPHGYHANILAQAKHELSGEFETKLDSKASEDAIVSEYQAFAERHPDFDQKWDSGELSKFMDEHPGHNAISAYLLMTQEDRTQAMIDEAVQKAVADTEAKFTSNQRAKREQRSIGAGPQTTGAPSGQVDAALKDTTKFGGRTTVLANRLRERRMNQAG